MINMIKEWIRRIKEEPELKNKYNILNAGYNEFYPKYLDIESKYEETEARMIIAERELKETKDKKIKLSEEETWKEYWSNKHPKKNISYLRHETDDDYEIDVRSFAIKNFDYPTITGKSYDEIAFKCLVWIIENITYIPDMTVYGYDEYWPYPYQTMAKRQGDCDSGAILLWNIMLHNGIPDEFIRLNAGDVKDPNGDNLVGHAYVTYFRDIGRQAVVLDWCYYVSYDSISERPIHKDMRDYFGIWWSTTSQQSYGNKKYMKGMPDKFNIVEVK